MRIAKRITALMLSAAMIVSGFNGIGFVKNNVYGAGEKLETSKVVSLSFENNVQDNSGKGNNGTLNNNGQYVEGVNGKAIYLDGKTYIDLGKSVDLQPANLTTSMWIKVDGTLSGENMITWFKPSGNYQGKGWYLTSLDDSTPIKISIGESSGQPMEAYVSGSRSEFFPSGEWVNIVVTYDSSSQKAAIYRNGVAQEVLYLNNASVISQDAASNKYIGFNSPGYNGGFAKLSLDEFRVYSSVATPSEVIDLYTEFGAGFDGNAIVDADYNNLDFSIKNIKSDITLPTEGNSGSTITWSSSDTSVISNTGKVTRPEEGKGDKEVKLTATIKYKDIEKTKEFKFTVLESYQFEVLKDFALSEVNVTDEYEKNALNKEIEYLKSLDADRLLKGFRTQAGIASDAKLYDGWENSAIKGHTLGHYLTAISQAYGTTGDEEILKTIKYIVDALKECQGESGYVAAIPESHYTQIENGNTSGTWVPWYTMHKVIAGLLSAYKETGYENALTVASKLGDWVYSRTSKWNAATQATVLSVEYGGMNDCLYELYKYTKNKNHLEAAHSFDEMSLFEALYNGEDVLNGKHANTTIPKIIGALNRYITLGESEEYYLTVAENFWDIVVNHHTYVTGGNSEWEHFGQADILDGERTECNCETCNTYNMLKLSRELYKLTGESKYADYYENTFINAILSSQNPETGMTTYFQPMATGYFKVYSSQFNHFWCCTGSGMENFTKLGDSIYYKGKDSIYITQYVDSTVTWKEQNLKLTQDSDIPYSDKTTFTVNALDGSKVNTILKIRIADWCAAAPEVKVNGNAVEANISRGIVTVKGPFSDGDKIEVTVPMQVVAYNLPDGENTIALKYGPIVLSASLGTDSLTTGTTGVNVTVPTKTVTINDTIGIIGTKLSQWLENINDNVVKTEGKLEFTLKNTDRDELVFTPHYMQYTDRYGIYFKYNDSSSVSSDSNQKKILEEKEAGRFNNVVIDSVPVSNDQYELQHNLVSSNSSTGSFKGLMYRDASAGGYFSYDMEVDSSVKNYLQVKYYSGDAGRTFKIYADDTVIAEVKLEDENPDNFYDKRYEIPQEAIKGKDTVNIKFETTGSSFAGGLFDRIYVVKDYASNASLKELIVNDKDYTNKISENMKIYVADDAEEAKIKFTPADEFGLVYVDGVLIDDTAIKTIALKDKSTTISIEVKGEDHESSNTYKIEIIKDSSKLNANEKISKAVVVVVVVVVVVLVIIAVIAVIIIKKKKKIEKKNK